MSQRIERTVDKKTETAKEAASSDNNAISICHGAPIKVITETTTLFDTVHMDEQQSSETHSVCSKCGEPSGSFVGNKDSDVSVEKQLEDARKLDKRAQAV